MMDKSAAGSVGTVRKASIASRSRPSLWTDTRLVLWNGLMILISPWLILHKIKRIFKRSNAAESDLNRWFLPPSQTEVATNHLSHAGPHVVLAGENFGELNLIRPLTDALRKEMPQLRITWMLRDAETIKKARVEDPGQAVCLWPFDFILPVGRFLDQVQPDVLILTERFRYTNLVCGSAHQGSKVVLINGRFRKIKPIVATVFGFLYVWTFECISVALMQTPEYVQSVKRFARPDAQVSAIGNLKEDIRMQRQDPKILADLCNWLDHNSGSPILAAGSTDGPAEESLVLEAFGKVRQSHKCRLLMAPRHLNRVKELVAEVKEAGFSYALRSSNENNADVLILDTLGELASAYKFTVAAYVGGSFDGMGHNILEPVLHGKPVSYGMRRGHFEKMQKSCESFGVGTRIGDASDLAAHWTEMLERPDRQREIAKAAELVVANQDDAFSVTLGTLLNVIRSRQFEG
jgi:3-deoxy-D-manno-octulosonic-acid transferase